MIVVFIADISRLFWFLSQKKTKKKETDGGINGLNGLNQLNSLDDSDNVDEAKGNNSLNTKKNGNVDEETEQTLKSLGMTKRMCEHKYSHCGFF